MMAQHGKSKDNKALNLISVGVLILVISLLSGNLKFLDHSGFTIIPSAKFGLALGLLICISGFLLNKSLPKSLNLISFSLGLLILILSNWIVHTYNLVQGPWIRGEIFTLSVVSFICLQLQPRKFIKSLPYIAIVILLYAFFSTSAGRLLHSDDHPTFLYRLSLLKATFPNIPFYSPIWNGGFDARDFFATGALNIFAIASPIIYLFPLEESYNIIVAGILFALVPICTWFAVRIVGGCRSAAGIASVLSISGSLLWYRWALVYGTMGFVTTTALIPLALSLTVKILGDPSEKSWKFILLTAAVITLMLFWSLSGIALLPILFFGFIYIRRWIGSKKIICLALLLCILNLPWISVFWSVSKVSTFIHSETAQQTEDGETIVPKHPQDNTYKREVGNINLKKSLKVLRVDSVSANPLLLLLALPGILLIEKRYRLMFIAVYLWLGFLGTILVPLKPQLELDRMLIMLYQLLALPTALSIRKLLRDTEQSSKFVKILPAFVIGLLLTAVFSTASIISNRTLDQHHYQTPLVDNLEQAIKQNTTTGRVIFSGFILHELDGGHIGPLAISTKKPLIASSQLHDMWKYKQVFPSEYISNGDTGIEKYLELYNVETVIAHERAWRNYFYERPEKYLPVWKEDLFHMFKVINYTSNYFLEGQGEITEQKINAVHLIPKTKDLIIKFNYFPFLKSNNCILEKEKISLHVSFIKLKDCTLDQEVIIDSVSAFKRIS
ncbi:MAG: hypothetical protein R3A13_06815 [Bdellovibrionota bacterium]